MALVVGTAGAAVESAIPLGISEPDADIAVGRGRRRRV
jgi:hypothetical protein